MIRSATPYIILMDGGATPTLCEIINDLDFVISFNRQTTGSRCYHSILFLLALTMGSPFTICAGASRRHSSTQNAFPRICVTEACFILPALILRIHFPSFTNNLLFYLFQLHSLIPITSNPGLARCWPFHHKGTV